jgi:hypothetical protein
VLLNEIGFAQPKQRRQLRDVGLGQVDLARNAAALAATIALEVGGHFFNGLP